MHGDPADVIAADLALAGVQPGAPTVIDRKTLACEQFRLVAAGPGGVPTAVPEASLVTDEDLVRAERVAVGASRRWVGDPLPARGLN